MWQGPKEGMQRSGKRKPEAETGRRVSVEAVGGLVGVGQEVVVLLGGTICA